VLASKDLEKSCPCYGRGRDDGPVLAVGWRCAVGEGVGEVWEEGRVGLGIVDVGGVVFVEGAVADVNYWFGGCVSRPLGVPLGMSLDVSMAWLGADQRSPQHAASECFGSTSHAVVSCRMHCTLHMPATCIEQ
jgi:hypothetical protein